MYFVEGMPRASYSTKDTTDPLNAEIDDDIYIDTTDLCKRIAWELKQHSIPQAIFAERILCRCVFAGFFIFSFVSSCKGVMGFT